MTTTIDELRQDLFRNGFVRIPASVFQLSEDQVEALRKSFANLFDGQYETGIYPDEIHWRCGISREDATREICNGWKADPMVASVVCSRALGELARGLMNWESSRLGQDDVLHKPPRSGPVGFHTDGAYISDNFVPLENNCLTMWMALDDADEENGALQYAPGSHMWNKEEEEKDGKDAAVAEDVSSQTFHVAEGQDHMASLRKAAVEAGRDPAVAVASVVTVPVKTGEMLVHHQDVWHGSGPNKSSSRHRRSLVAHILNGKVEWRAEKPHYIYGRYYIKGESVPREDFFPFSQSA